MVTLSATARHFIILVGALLLTSAAMAQSTPPKPVALYEVPSGHQPTANGATLGIPDRAQGPNAPPEGWCGESAIQQALLFHGAWFPQAIINKAGRPSHPDLYASDIPVALRALGVSFSRAKASLAPKTHLAWLRKQVDAGTPVLAGVKINPTKHPQWGLDHFVIINGYTGQSFDLNTTWSQTIARSDAQLMSKDPGLGFANGSGRFYALAIHGSAQRPVAKHTTRLFVEQETPNALTAIVTCDNLQVGQEYDLSRSNSFKKAGAVRLAFKATASTHAFRVHIDAAQPAVFRCAPTP